MSRPDLIVLDLMLPEMSGIEFCGRLRRSDPDQKKLYEALTMMIRDGWGSASSRMSPFRSARAALLRPHGVASAARDERGGAPDSLAQAGAPLRPRLVCTVLTALRYRAQAPIVDGLNRRAMCTASPR